MSAASGDQSQDQPKDVLLFARRIERALGEVSQRLMRSALSLPLAAGYELGCVFTDPRGRAIAEAGADPVLTGSLGPQIRAVLAATPTLARDVVLALSDPYPPAAGPLDGGIDLQTLTLIGPVHVGESSELCGYLALAVRHPQPPLGAPLSPTELPPSRDDELSALPPAVGPRYAEFQAPVPPTALPRTLDEEGRRLPARLATDALLRELATHGRSPRERLGDLLAQRAALRFAVSRLRELVIRYGSERFQALAAAVLREGEAEARRALAALPDGVYAFADSLDDDSAGSTDVGIRVTCRVHRGGMQLDLRECDDAVPGPLNTTAAAVVAVVRHTLRGFVGSRSRLPSNDGLLAPVEILLRPGSLLAARPPAALALGAFETARRLYDVLRGVLSQAAPAAALAADCGTTSSLFLAGRSFLHREALGGGMGGGPGTLAASRRLGTSSLAAELLERQLPVRVWRHAVRPDSGGGGTHTGANGELRELELLSDMDVTVAGERRCRPPYGLAGGGPGMVGRDTLTRAGETRLLPGKVCFQGQAGDRLTLQTPGGGGYGDVQRAAFFVALLGE